MKKMSFAMIMVCLLAAAAMAADVKLDWDGVDGATGYKIAMSTDLGVTWSYPIDMKLVKPYTYTGVPEDRLVLFKIAAYNASATTWKEYAFAAYDHRKKPLPETSGPGIK